MSEMVKKIIARFSKAASKAADTLVGPKEIEDPKEKDDAYWKEKKRKIDAAIEGKTEHNPEAIKRERKGREIAAKTPVQRPKKTNRNNEGYKKRGARV